MADFDLQKSLSESSQDEKISVFSHDYYQEDEEYQAWKEERMRQIKKYDEWEEDERKKRIRINELFSSLSCIVRKYDNHTRATHVDIFRDIIHDANEGIIEIDEGVLATMKEYKDSLHPEYDCSEHLQFAQHLENVVECYIRRKT